MPSAYAHYRFGSEVLKKLPAAVRKCIEANRALYDIGVHGPDILFYYHPLKKTDTRSEDARMHDRPARVFFNRAAEIIRPLRGEARQRALAYAYGFITHFSLDSASHTHVEMYKRQLKRSHTAIEVDYDRRLMRLDKCPERCPVAHIVADAAHAQTIAPFYIDVSEEQVLHSLKSMRFYGRLLDTRNPLLQKVIEKVGGIIDPSGELPGWMADGHDPVCEGSYQGLLERWPVAVERALALMGEFEDVLAEKIPLNAAYAATFGAVKE